jgi:pimeloyl-ACP methyl ester carboxylesterase
MPAMLGSMPVANHVVLIHGSWCRGQVWAEVRAAFEARGYTVHTPTLRHHELPLREGATKVAALSLRDYTDDLVALVTSLDSPPLLIGHSMGGLLAQLVAARTHQAGVVAACPGPAAGTFGATRSGFRATLPHLLRPRPWSKPWHPPTFEQFRRWVANAQTEDVAREVHDGLVSESGRYVWELFAAIPRLSRATVVDFAAVTTPVLAIGADRDRMVAAAIARQTAARYRHGSYVEIPGSDHMVFTGAALPVTMGHIDEWIASNRVLA